MEALAALSLVCNVLQLVGVSLKASKALKAIRDEHKPDSSAQGHADILRQLSHEVKQCVTTQGSSGNATLCTRADEVVAVAWDLEKLLLRFTTGKKNKFLDGLAYLWKQGDIKALEQRLQRAQDALQSTVLLDVWRNVHSQWDTIKIHLPSFTSSLQTLVSELQRGNNNILDIIAKQDANQQTTLQALDGIKLDVRHISDNLVKQGVESQQDSKLDEFVASLYFPSMNARRNMQSIVAAKGTFQWVLDSQNQPRHETTTNDGSDQRMRTLSMLRLWLGNPNQRVFWISGKPGSGKSTLMHYLTDKIPERFNVAPGGGNDASPMVISAFLWASGDELQKSIEGLLCTLLRQIFLQSSRLARAALQAQNPSAKKVSVSDWSESELLRTLAVAIESLERPVYTFIDGLDEIQPGGRSPERLIDLVRSLSIQGNVKLCVSSRPEVFWERALQYYPHFRLQDLTWDDMEYHAWQELASALESKPESTLWNHDFEAVLRHLIDRAEGVFLWLHLVIQSLKAGITNDDSWELLWERIDELPTDLESLYENMVSRLERGTKNYKTFAATVFALLLAGDHFEVKDNCETWMDRVLSITLYVNTNLRRRVIETDVGIDDVLSQEVVSGGERVCRQIRAQCAGLVEVSPRDEYASLGMNQKLKEHRVTKVAFVHRTVRDFLLDAGRRLWQDAMPPDFPTVCLEVQLASLWMLGNRITSMGLWDPPTVFEIDLTLLYWCGAVDANLPGNPREAVFEHLAQLMTTKGIWNKETRNPAILAVACRYGIEIPRRWLASWTPSGMTTADFVDHLLVASLSILDDPSTEAVRWLCESGANPARRSLTHWPGTNWPSAFAMAMSHVATRPGHYIEALHAIIKLGINFEEQLTVVYQRCSYCGFALSRYTPSFIFGAEHLSQRFPSHSQRYIPVLQLRIPAFLWLTLSDIKHPRYAGKMKMLVADQIRQCSSISCFKIQLLGFVSVTLQFTPPYHRHVLIITGGHKIERELVLTSGTLDPVASQQAVDECHAEIETILQVSLQDPMITRMDSQETIDWLLDSDFAEDMRDEYYNQLLSANPNSDEEGSHLSSDED